MKNALTITPKSAYQQLTNAERNLVDEYVAYCVDLQRSKRERIANALSLPIPSEFVVRSNSTILKASVLSAITEQINKAQSEQDISPDRIIHEFASIAFSRVNDILQETDYGLTLRPIEDIPASAFGAIKNLKIKPTNMGNVVEIVMHDKTPALNKLCEFMSLVPKDERPVLHEYAKPINHDTLSIDSTISDTEDAYNELLEDIKSS